MNPFPSHLAQSWVPPVLTNSKQVPGLSWGDTSPGDTHLGLGSPWSHLPDNAALQLSKLPDPVYSAISEIISPFSCCRANRKTGLPAMIKYEDSELGRGRRTGQRQTRSRPSHALLLSPCTSPRIWSYFGILFEVSFSCTLCSTCKYSVTHFRQGKKGYFTHTLSWKDMIIVKAHIYWAFALLCANTWHLISHWFFPATLWGVCYHSEHSRDEGRKALRR